MSNSNCGESAVVKFQPMPKRFIAWNKYKKKLGDEVPYALHKR